MLTQIVFIGKELSRQKMLGQSPFFFMSRPRLFVVQLTMPITLTPEQEAWFRAHVASGEFASIEEAARQVIDERIAADRRGKGERKREALRVGDLSDADLEAIAATEMAARHQHLDNELK